MALIFFLVYAILGLAGVACCLVIHRKYRVVSSFTEVFGGLFGGFPFLALSPSVLLVGPAVVLFCAIFWPALCLWDLSAISEKRRIRYNRLKEQQAERRTSRKDARERRQQYLDLIGETGETLGALSPMGQVRIHGTVWEAVSISGYVPSSQKIVVTGRSGKALEVACPPE